MKIRFVTTMAGPGGVIAAGAVKDVSDGEADRLIGAGIAVPVVRTVENAKAAGGETATAAAQRQRVR